MAPTRSKRKSRSAQRDPSAQPNEPHSTLAPGSSAFRSSLAGFSVAKPLAPEDICRGDYVALLHEMYELPSYWWPGDTSLHPRDELVCLRLVPTQENAPLKVKSICLPFVLTQQPDGEQRTLDLRRCRLARLDPDYAAAAWKAYKKKSKRTATSV